MVHPDFLAAEIVLSPVSTSQLLCIILCTWIGLYMNKSLPLYCLDVPHLIKSVGHPRLISLSEVPGMLLINRFLEIPSKSCFFIVKLVSSFRSPTLLVVTLP